MTAGIDPPFSRKIQDVITDAILANHRLHPEAHLISFSECGHDQELMLVMPAFSWLRGRLGAFFLEPEPQKPWKAHLMLSA